MTTLGNVLVRPLRFIRAVLASERENSVEPAGWLWPVQKDRIPAIIHRDGGLESSPHGLYIELPCGAPARPIVAAQGRNMVWNVSG